MNRMNNFQKNLRVLANKYTQKQIAERTGFSQSSINNYLTKSSEPSIQFLVALKNSFGICIDDFLFADIEIVEEKSYERFVGNYIVYYYNNNSYKGEVHTNLSNTLNYGVISVLKDKDSSGYSVYGTFINQRSEAIKLLKSVNIASSTKEIYDHHAHYNNFYAGFIEFNDQTIFFELRNKINGDQTYMIFNNPHSQMAYVGGIGTVNSVSRGREHNPCIEFVLMSKNVLDRPDGEIYECLKFSDYVVNLDFAIKDLVDLFKRLYVEKNDMSSSLNDQQKTAIIKNKLEYHFNDILDANVFRFAKISNKDDDMIYKIIKEGMNV